MVGDPVGGAAGGRLLTREQVHGGGLAAPRGAHHLGRLGAGAAAGCG